MAERSPSSGTAASGRFADEDGPTSHASSASSTEGRATRGATACPDLEDQSKVAELLDIERIGVALTEEFHLVPEQST